MKLWLALIACVLIGAGCVPGPGSEQAAIDLKPTVGMELTLRDSAFGLLGTIVEAAGKGAGFSAR